jgi:hypothetical protein
MGIALGDELPTGMDSPLAKLEEARTKHARTRAGFIRLLLDDRPGASALFEKAISLDESYFHAHLGRALCDVDVEASLSQARAGARRVHGFERDSIAALDLVLLAILIGEDPRPLPQRPRDAGKLLLFTLRVEAAARSPLSSGAVLDLRAAVSNWLVSLPSWLGKAEPSA